MSMAVRMLAALAACAVVVALFFVLRGGDDRYMAKLVLKDAGGLREGANVRINGAPSGRVTGLEIDSRDRAVATLRIDERSAPVGKDARAIIDSDGFFGERYVALDRGDTRYPARDGATIPEPRTQVSVRLDDVVDSLDVDTRQALQVFLREQGMALAGRGKDLGNTLAALPPSLESTGRLLDQFASDNRSIGELVEASDRVVAELAPQRRQLGRVVSAAGVTLDALAARRDNVGETVRQAPPTLRQARATLAELERTAEPLAPAARGLRRTAEPLAGTLKELPGFARAASPTLTSLRRTAPALQRLADEGTPVVKDLAPMTTQLRSYAAQALVPAIDVLAQGTPNLFGVMEGWARSTQGRDAAGQVFRFGATSATDSFDGLLRPSQRRGGTQRERKEPSLAQPGRPAVPVSKPTVPDVKVPGLPTVKVPRVPLVDDTLQGVQDTVNGLLGGGRSGGRPQINLDGLDFLLGDK